jgi:hypothetical protein
LFLVELGAAIKVSSRATSAGGGYAQVHVVIDDTTALVYVEVLPDEQQGTAIGFLSRALAWFNRQGVD